MTLRHCAVFASLAIGLGSGCTTVRGTAEDKAAVWLAEAPRTVSVKVAGELPEGSVRVMDYKVNERIGQGLATGAYVGVRTILYFCAGGPIGCAIGAIGAPFTATIGAVGGAASVNSVERRRGLQEADGAVELYKRALKPIDVAREMEIAIIGEAGSRTAHRYVAAGDPAAADAQARLQLSIDAIDLAGDVGEDPSVSLVFVASATLATPEATVRSWPSFSYRGKSRRLSEWLKDDAQLFREELNAASRSFAKDLAPHLAWRPGRAAVDAVMDERKSIAAAAARAAQAAPLVAPVPLVPALPREGDRFVYRLSDPAGTRASATLDFRVKAVSRRAIVEGYVGPHGVERQWTHSDAAYVIDEGASVFSPYFAATGDAESASRLSAVQNLDHASCALLWTCRTRVRVVGWERVAVPAGEFDALKLELLQEWSSGNSRAGRQIGERVLEVWYAAGVKRAVKFSSREKTVQGDALVGDFDLELVAYRAAP